jgi:hypothetical protein
MQHNIASRNQVGRPEWFGDVVVRTGFERFGDFLLNVRAGCQEDPNRLSGCADLMA